MADPKKIKPRAKTQSELTRDQITAYDKSAGVPPASTKRNRENQISVKDDNTKLPTIGLKDIDEAVMYYFNNVIRPTVNQNGSEKKVPILYGNPERWSAVQRDGFYRDRNGKIQVPLIMFKKNSITKDRSLGNKLDGNEVNNFIIYEKKYSKRNIYDRFSILANRNPSKELYGVVVPDYVTVEYSCVVFTDYIQQCDKIVEAINFSSDSYWGDKERYRFRASIDSFNTTVDMNQGQDRAVKATFTIKLHGYIITDTYNRDMANLKKFYSKSQLNFQMETAGTLDEIENRVQESTQSGAVRFADSELNKPQVFREGMEIEEIIYLSTNSTAIATSLSGTVATFAGFNILTPPEGFPAITKDDFEVYLNGRRFPSSQITSISQQGTAIEVNVDLAAFLETPGSTFEIDDQVLLTGKFK
jgi:hypothetical protein